MYPRALYQALCNSACEPAHLRLKLPQPYEFTRYMASSDFDEDPEQEPVTLGLSERTNMYEICTGTEGGELYLLVI